MSKPRTSATVRAAVDRELRKLKATTSVEGRQAQKLAGIIDTQKTARDAAAVHKELREILTGLRERAAREDSQSPLAKIQAERAQRRRSVVVELEAERDRRRPG